MNELPRTEPTTRHRIVALAYDAALSVQVGTALPLLQRIIVLCGKGTSCLLALRELEASSGVPHPTLKSWLKKLAESGFIEKTPAGRDGVRVTLTPDLLGKVDTIASPDPIARAIMKVASLQTVLDAAARQLITELQSVEATV